MQTYYYVLLVLAGLALLNCAWKARKSVHLRYCWLYATCFPLWVLGACAERLRLEPLALWEGLQEATLPLMAGFAVSLGLFLIYLTMPRFAGNGKLAHFLKASQAMVVLCALAFALQRLEAPKLGLAPLDALPAVVGGIFGVTVIGLWRRRLSRWIQSQSR